ncbi:MAG: phosphocholine cytidylyltransferase family protein [Planctomycetota bacterium]|nr:phosphocholine cytidylyltransferase family protein [Planctomycetota bacterium]
MKAILLAAGVGRRLKPITDTTPKCLIEIGGKTLLERHFEAFRHCGIRLVTIVLGHLAGQVRAKAETLASATLACEFVMNDRYELGSILSLHAASRSLADGAIVMDADVLYPAKLLKRLVDSGKVSCFLMDSRAKAGGEEMMIAARAGRVLRITRRPGEGWEQLGEGVGFLKIGRQHAPVLEKLLQRFVDEDRLKCEYEDAIDEFLKSCEAGFEDVSDLPWTEIDFPEDIAKAEREVLPLLG